MLTYRETASKNGSNNEVIYYGGQSLIEEINNVINRVIKSSRVPL